MKTKLRTYLVNYTFMLFFNSINYKINMKTYCLVCRKDTDNINSKMIKTKNDRLMLSSSVLCVKIKSQDLSQKKKQKDQES